MLDDAVNMTFPDSDTFDVSSMYAGLSARATTLLADAPTYKRRVGRVKNWRTMCLAPKTTGGGITCVLMMMANQRIRQWLAAFMDPVQYGRLRSSLFNLCHLI